MPETLVILLLFLGALAYLANLARQAFSRQSAGCPKGCGTCAATEATKKRDAPA